MGEHRMEARNQGYAKVILDSQPGYLRNLTDDGCKIVMLSALGNEVGEELTFRIIPEETSGVEPLTVDAELRWKKADGPYFVYGFHIDEFASREDANAYHALVAQYGRS